ncbi:dehydrogenase [Anopheles sinensis]|uniref:Dehydrogenase n=1 Tax=Anopheles sinensis TaxID=74873 RepID=A0A084VDL2_ANOSI|nr:dehydrogenase [Anopheles sinensis]
MEFEVLRLMLMSMAQFYHAKSQTSQSHIHCGQGRARTNGTVTGKPSASNCTLPVLGAWKHLGSVAFWLRLERRKIESAEGGSQSEAGSCGLQRFRKRSL